MTPEEARAIAQRDLDEQGCTVDGRRIIIRPGSESAEDLGWCWVLHPTTERFMKTGKLSDALPLGWGPIAVTKKDGGICYLGSNPSARKDLPDWGVRYGYLFRVARVFRIASRPGPALVGKAPETMIRTGTEMTPEGHPDTVLTVAAVDPQTKRMRAENMVAIVVTPDPGDLLQRGTVLVVR